jgi:hypothetical protein
MAPFRSWPRPGAKALRLELPQESHSAPIHRAYELQYWQCVYSLRQRPPHPMRDFRIDTPRIVEQMSASIPVRGPGNFNRRRVGYVLRAESRVRLNKNLLSCFRAVRCKPCSECIELQWGNSKRTFAFDSYVVFAIEYSLSVTRYSYGVYGTRPTAWQDMISDRLNSRRSRQNCSKQQHLHER